MELLSNTTARKLVAYTPSTYISNKVDQLPSDLAAKFPSLTQAGTSARTSASRAAFDGFQKGLSVNRYVATGSVFAPAASRHAIELPYVGRLLVPQSAAFAVVSEFATPLIDSGVGRLLDGANRRSSQTERLMAVGIKLGALFFFEVPRLAVTSLRVGAALAVGGAGAVLGLGYYALMATGDALRGRGNTVGTPGEAVDTVADAAQDGASTAADSAKDAAATVTDEAEKAAQKTGDEAEKALDKAS